MARRRLRARVLGGVAFGIVAGAALGGGIALAADHAVAISGFSFSPRELTVAVGDTVTWTNSDAQAHTATADDGSFDTGDLDRGDAKGITLDEPGTYSYYCRFHPFMKATVEVQ